MFKGIIKYNSFFFTLPILASLALIFRALLPFQLALSGGAFFVFSVFYLFKFSLKDIFNDVISALKSGILFFTVALILLIVIAYSKTGLSIVEKEAFRVISSIIMFVLLYIVSKRKGIVFVINKFIDLFLLFVLVIVFYAIYRLSNPLYSLSLFSRSIDFNMFSMYLIMTIILIAYKLHNKKYSKWKIYGFNLFLFILTIIIIFSSSRRGIIILGALFIVILCGLIIRSYRKTSKKFGLYFILLTLLVTTSFFIVANNNLRYYLTTQIKSNSFKWKLNAIASDYNSIVSKDPNIIHFFHPLPVGSKTIRKEILKNYSKNQDVNSVYQSINNLALFTKSRKELNSLIKEAKIIPDTIFTKQNTIQLPNYYNLDYNFKYSFIPISFGNCELRSFTPNVNDSTFVFQSLKPNDRCRILSFLPLSDSSRFTLEFTYFDSQQSTNIKIFDKKRNPLPFVLMDTVVNIGVNKFKKQYRVEIFDAESDQLCIEIDFVAPYLKMSNVNWTRQSLSSEAKYSPVKAIFNKQDYNKRIDLIKKLHNPNQHLLINRDSLLLIHDLILANEDFRNYARCEIDSITNTNAFFNVTDNYGAVMKKVPTIPGQKYVVSYYTNIDPQNLFYRVGRYPQVEPEFTKIVELKKEFTKEGELFFVKDSFIVEDCLSLRSSLVIGSKIKDDSLVVSKFKYKIYPDTKEICLSPRQLKGAQELFRMANIADRQNARSIQDSLLNFYGLNLPTKETDLLTGRLLHYKLGFSLFKRYNLIAKLIGNQFSYLNIYGKVFYSEDTDYGYPHNPVISAVLYSGVVGGILYLWFLVLAIVKYIKGRKKFSIFFILFIIAFAFSFFSGNSHFSIPIFTLLSFIPFLNTKTITNND
ncbi:MAG: hypothetical protein JEZ09_00170 [Salinivirgaceae bacterium]|nr:hypothetical protein [Salinivirgaceae bacterium]